MHLDLFVDQDTLPKGELKGAAEDVPWSSKTLVFSPELGGGKVDPMKKPNERGIDS